MQITQAPTSFGVASPKVQVVRAQITPVLIHLLMSVADASAGRSGSPEEGEGTLRPSHGMAFLCKCTVPTNERCLMHATAQVMRQHQLSSHHVFVNETLVQLAQMRPTKVEVCEGLGALPLIVAQGLEKIPSFTSRKLEQYGPAILAIIKTFCDEKQLSTDQPSASVMKQVHRLCFSAQV